MSEELIKITQLIAVGFSGISFGVAIGNVVWSFANYKELKKNLREIEEEIPNSGNHPLKYVRAVKTNAAKAMVMEMMERMREVRDSFLASLTRSSAASA